VEVEVGVEAMGPSPQPTTSPAPTTVPTCGRVHGWKSYMFDARFPTMGSDCATHVEYTDQGITGTIPTQV
jgi:hypothetical protein